jgi:hypothetical protein
MQRLKPLEESVLERYQYLIEEFEPDNVASEFVFGFVQYCSGCIAMFKKLNPEAPFKELRPFFGQQPDPRPLESTNEAALWVHGLASKLEQVLLEKQQGVAGGA